MILVALSISSMNGISSICISGISISGISSMNGIISVRPLER